MTSSDRVCKYLLWLSDPAHRAAAGTFLLGKGWVRILEEYVQRNGITS